MDLVKEITKAMTESIINGYTYKIEDYDKNIEDLDKYIERNGNGIEWNGDLDTIDPKDLNSDTINIIAVKTFIGLLYTQRTRLKEREERKHKDHEWECDLCQKQYGCIKELKEHEKKEHEWKCDECKNQYVCINELDKHLKKEHGVKKHGCKECGKRFENLEEAIVHMKNCFICDFCDYGCTESRKDFEFHMKRRHDRNCYTCDLCDDSSSRSRKDFENHIRWSHNKNCYICEQCSNW